MTQVENVTLPMLPLRGLTLFPHVPMHFEVGRKRSVNALEAAMKDDQRIFLSSQKDITIEDPGEKDVYAVGVVGEVRQVLKMPDGNLRVLVEGLYRAKCLERTEGESYPIGVIAEHPLKPLRPSEETYCAALVRTLRNLFEEYASVSPKLPKDITMGVMSKDDPTELAEFVASYLLLKTEQKQAVLEQSDPVRRLELLVAYIDSENQILTLEKDIFERVHEAMDKNQREYFLREQMKVISDELGMGDDIRAESMEYTDKLERLSLPEDTAVHLRKEIDKLRKVQPLSPESGVIRNYLDWCFALPWDKETKDKIDLPRAQRTLDRDHYGLEKVKERILELLAVRKLAPDVHGQIICLVGPPGTGKTSVARSIAKAVGRKYIRVSLGGVRDEADIRGHRRTYIGAMPGRILSAIRTAGVKNPLFLLDEVDKLGSDFRGDPSSALLEVLDPEQNSAFVDHFIEVPFDLSRVLFLATANTTETIPPALLDRMEIIQLSSYTREEKFHIAKSYLVSKQLAANGLNGRILRIKDDALYALIDFYTREAGVRKLERTIASLCRKAARKLVGQECGKVVIAAQDLHDYLGAHKYKPESMNDRDEVGLVNGLAWTQVGGETMPIEVAVLSGSGKLELTGSLGDVMKESAHAATSCIRSRADALGIEPDFYKTKDIHIHVPEGAVPKDGPSAGIAMATAVISALTGKPVRRDVAMTGEITLRGRVLPIGGLKEKTMAAYRCGIRTVILPEDNLPDLDEVAQVVKDAVTFVPARVLEDVLAVVFASDKEN